MIALAMSYAPASDPLALASETSRGRISVYAQGADYHKVVKKALKAMGRWLADERGLPAEGVRRHRAGDGEAAVGRRPGSAGRASTPICSAANMAIGCSSA